MQGNGDPSRAFGTPGWSQTPEKAFKVKLKKKKKMSTEGVVWPSVPPPSGLPPQLCCYSCLALCLSQVPPPTTYPSPLAV